MLCSKFKVKKFNSGELLKLKREVKNSMSLPDSILEIETAEIDVSSNVNFTFDWGTIGIIIGCVVGLLVVIFAIAFFCGRGRQKFSLKKP